MGRALRGITLDGGAADETADLATIAECGVDRGDVLLIDGQRYIVQGVDPSGSTPRLVYLENCDTHERSFVDFEDVDARNVVRPRLRLIRGEGEQFGDRRER